MGLARPARGLTYYDANMGRFVEEGPDVTEAKVKLRELDSNLSAWYDREQLEWHVTWWNEKLQQDEWILSDRDLESAYQRMLKARNDRPGAETGNQMDDRLAKEQKKQEEKEMEVFREIAAEGAERLAHAFAKDGLHDHENIYGPSPRRDLARKDVRVREPR